MTKEVITYDMDNMIEVMSRTVSRTDIWQDRCIYWMAVALWHILDYIRRKEGLKSEN